MIFTTWSFFTFLAVVYILLLLIRNDTARRWILLAASVFFYGYWNPWYVFLVFAVIVWSWTIGLFIASTTDLREKKFGVATGTFLSLLALATFKYADFFSENILLFTGIEIPKTFRNIVLPVGISFYTFHSISYYIDVYRNRVQVARSLRDYSIYILFFPQLVAGPIVRAAQFLPQLGRPVEITLPNLAAGARLFVAGAVQKLLLADQVSPFVDKVFATPELYSGTTEWLAVLAYALQIFGDFSGYTLMAIGIGLLLGYRLPENFRMPYVSTSIAEFWRRWHITLSFFLRDYLYIPLGGNRHGFLKTQCNVLITMALGGLWHGASWNFVFWGSLHGVAIIVNHIWKRIIPAHPDEFASWRYAQRPFCWLLTFVFVIMAWIPFRAVHFSDTVTILVRIWTLAEGINWFHTPTVCALLVAFIWHCAYLVGLRGRLAAFIPDVWLYTIEMSAMLSLLLLFAPTNTSPFIYFQF